MFVYGAGYNLGFISSNENKALMIPEFVTHIELGMAELKRWNLQKIRPDVSLSLHLARTPITEENDSQEKFIEYLHENFSAIKLISIGVHLIGFRSEGIGKFGFSSHFTSSDINNKQAIRFIKKLKQQFEIPIWLENANFYSDCIVDILNVWQSIKWICENSGAELIVDLSHLIIDARNNNLNPMTLLGAIPWQYVVEVHLSGVTISANGSWHDGHSKFIHPEVWDLLKVCINFFLDNNKQIFLTIEHTDPVWTGKQKDYIIDFLKLKSMIEKIELPKNDYKNLADLYAKSYLKKLLKQWSPMLISALEEKNISFDITFDNWIEKVLKNKQRVVLTSAEILPSEIDKVCIACPDFLNYVKGVLTSSC